MSANACVTTLSNRSPANDLLRCAIGDLARNSSVLFVFMPRSFLKSGVGRASMTIPVNRLLNAFRLVLSLPDAGSSKLRLPREQ